MVDESLLLYLRDHLLRAAPLIPGFDEQARATLDERLRELLAYNDLEPRFSRDELRHLIIAIDTLTVIDPACGSGAFPMGVLQKLVYLLNKLDPATAAGRRGSSPAPSRSMTRWPARPRSRASRRHSSATTSTTGASCS
jgi:hypothetical protein